LEALFTASAIPVLGGQRLEAIIGAINGNYGPSTRCLFLGYLYVLLLIEVLSISMFTNPCFFVSHKSQCHIDVEIKNASWKHLHYVKVIFKNEGLSSGTLIFDSGIFNYVFPPSGTLRYCGRVVFGAPQLFWLLLLC